MCQIAMGSLAVAKKTLTFYKAQLSQSARQVWSGRLDSIERLTVFAMVERRATDSGEEYRERCKSEQWEIPVAEVFYLEGK